MKNAILIAFLIPIFGCASSKPVKKSYLQDSKTNIEINTELNTQNSPALEPVGFEIQMTPLNVYYFDYNSDSITDKDSKYLKDNIEAIKSSPIPFVVIRAHSDNRGSDKFNRILSISRAKSLAEVYAASGIPIESIQIEGMGESKPVCSDDTDECHLRNRRTETFAMIQFKKKELNTP